MISDIVIILGNFLPQKGTANLGKPPYIFRVLLYVPYSTPPFYQGSFCRPRRSAWTMNGALSGRRLGQRQSSHWFRVQRVGVRCSSGAIREHPKPKGLKDSIFFSSTPRTLCNPDIYLYDPILSLYIPNISLFSLKYSLKSHPKFVRILVSWQLPHLSSRVFCM